MIIWSIIVNVNYESATAGPRLTSCTQDQSTLPKVGQMNMLNLWISLVAIDPMIEVTNL